MVFSPVRNRATYTYGGITHTRVFRCSRHVLRAGTSNIRARRSLQRAGVLGAMASNAEEEEEEEEEESDEADTEKLRV